MHRRAYRGYSINSAFAQMSRRALGLLSVSRAVASKTLASRSASVLAHAQPEMFLVPETGLSIHSTLSLAET